MPKGYIIGHVTISDPEAYQAYAQRNNDIFPSIRASSLSVAVPRKSWKGLLKRATW